MDLSMKKKTLWKVNMGWVIALLLFLSLCLPVQASDSGGQKGSIQLRFSESRENLEMTLYAVADYVDGGYVFSDDFAECGIAITNLNDSKEAQEAAQALAEYAVKHNTEGIKAVPDGDGLVSFRGLSPALYLAAQSGGSETMDVQAALIPIPYVGEDGSMVYDAEIAPKYSFPGGAVIVTKVDEEGNTVGKAQFVLQQKTYLKDGEAVPEGAQTGSDEQGSFYWKEFRSSLTTSEYGQIVVTDMPVGDYRFVEIQAPDGFVLNAEPAYFAIAEAGQVAQVQGVYEKEDGQVAEVQVVNQQTSVRFHKVDEAGNPVSGAKLVLKDADGNVILDEEGNAEYAFTSGTEAYVLKRLPAGDYYLCEVDAPDGYRVAQDVALTVSGTDAAAAEVTMVDEKEETTSAQLAVTKRLVDMEDNELSTENGVFYVALFADEGLTERVSGVKPLEYHGNSASVVTFQNLQMGMTYYISETDAFGNPLEGIEMNEKVICTPLYPDAAGITPTNQNPEHEFSFDNVFLELPDGYYYVGSLTVTKEVLRGTEPYDTDEVFYAGVFEDAEYTQLAGDVIVLDMSGGSTCEVTVEVPIGESTGMVKNYYVTETDANGVPLKGRSDLKFEVSVDKEQVSFSTENPSQTVKITNNYTEATVTPTPDATVTPGGTTPGSSSSTDVRTGDDTPIGMFVVILLAAAAAVAGILIYRKKKK